jgi:hypothetical protein
MKYNSGLFYGPIFIAFGLGLSISNVLPHTDGIYYLGTGFIISIIGMVVGRDAEVEVDE